MTDPRVRGLHHVTAIAGDPQVNVDFYAGVLGLALRQTARTEDDPDHLPPATTATPWVARAPA
ncbi:MAG: VOC family protein [Halofilum sp. (in: g-proteobacteria)]|nr:VOC family protein [Halofilum sp. (in: g-proteobacteria)]